MKNRLIIIATVLGLALAIGLAAQPDSTKSTHLGTWELASLKYGDAQDFTGFPKSQRRLKFITPNHFTWVQYDTAGKKVQGVAGGSYTLAEDTYTETIEFVDDGMSSYLGGKHAFKIKIDGDKFFLSGQLSDGLKIEEIWRRIK